MDNQLYHSGCEFSSHQLVKMLVSPRHFYEEVIMAKHHAPNDAMISGTILHTLVLEPELAHTEEHLHSQSKYPIEDLKDAAANLDCHKKCGDILNSKDRHVEESMFFDLEGLACRARPDLYTESGILADVKTTSNLKRFNSAVTNFHYDFQLGMYFYAILKTRGIEMKRAVFLAVEPKPPFNCGLIELDQEKWERAKEKVLWAARAVKWCIDNDNWR